jgi:hypothetical protein
MLGLQTPVRASVASPIPTPVVATSHFTCAKKGHGCNIMHSQDLPARKPATHRACIPSLYLHVQCIPSLVHACAMHTLPCTCMYICSLIAIRRGKAKQVALTCGSNPHLGGPTSYHGGPRVHIPTVQPIADASLGRRQL